MRIHIVKDRESLYDIAKQYYGFGPLWRVIFRKNKQQIENKNIIHIGQTLQIPTIPFITK